MLWALGLHFRVESGRARRCTRLVVHLGMLVSDSGCFVAEMFVESNAIRRCTLYQSARAATPACAATASAPLRPQAGGRQQCAGSQQPQSNGPALCCKCIECDMCDSARPYTLPLILCAACRCIECGFCESNCPSKDLTLTPRQRIATFKEIARLRAMPDKCVAGICVQFLAYLLRFCAQPPRRCAQLLKAVVRLRGKPTSVVPIAVLASYFQPRWLLARQRMSCTLCTV